MKQMHQRKEPMRVAAWYRIIRQRTAPNWSYRTNTRAEGDTHTRRTDRATGTTKAVSHQHRSRIRILRFFSFLKFNEFY